MRKKLLDLVYSHLCFILHQCDLWINILQEKQSANDKQIFHISKSPFRKTHKTHQGKINRLFVRTKMGRLPRKKNHKTSKSGIDTPTRKQSVFYLGSLYLVSDNKHINAPEVHCYFWLQLVSGKSISFLQYTTDFPPFLYSLLSVQIEFAVYIHVCYHMSTIFGVVIKMMRRITIYS